MIQATSSSTTHLVSTTSAASDKTITVSKSTAGKTFISSPDTTTQATSSSTTHLVSTTSATSGKTSTGSKSTAESCDVERCPKKCTEWNPCLNGGTCSCEATCTAICNCGSAYTGSKCELGADIVTAVLRQDAPKVSFDMIVIFGSTDLNTSTQETMLREQFGNLSGFNHVSVSPLKEGTTNDYPVTAKFDYTNDNFNKVYNGGLKDDIKNKFRSQVRATRQEKMTLRGEVNQTNVPMEDLDKVFQCNSNYEGYIVLFDSTGVFCKSPCTDPSYCNNHGNCTHLQTGPNCSCDPACTDKQKCTGCNVDTNLFEILFGTLGALLGVGILLGIVCYCVKRRSPSKSIVADDHIYYTC
uniref:mucin-4-like n=1 Tax=Myxine glutinosa TaxID=7769 RepID=UPI00358F79A8